MKITLSLLVVASAINALNSIETSAALISGMKDTGCFNHVIDDIKNFISTGESIKDGPVLMTKDGTDVVIDIKDEFISELITEYGAVAVAMLTPLIQLQKVLDKSSKKLDTIYDSYKTEEELQREEVVRETTTVIIM